MTRGDAAGSLQKAGPGPGPGVLRKKPELDCKEIGEIPDPDLLPHGILFSVLKAQKPVFL